MTKVVSPAYAPKTYANSTGEYEYDAPAPEYSGTSYSASDPSGPEDRQAQYRRMEEGTQASSGNDEDLFAELEAMSAEMETEEDYLSETEMAGQDDGWESEPVGPSAAAQLKTFEESIQKNSKLSERQKKFLLEKIKEISQQIKNNTDSNDVDLEAVLEPLRERIGYFEGRNQAFRKEAKRAAGLGYAIELELDRALEATELRRVQGDASGELAAGTGTALGAAAGGIAAATMAGAATASMAAVGSGVAIGATVGSAVPVLGTAIGAAVGFGAGLLVGNLMSETKGPKSTLKHLTPDGRRLDVIMHGKSGMGGSLAGSDVTRILYNTKLTPAKQVKALQEVLNGLPIASRAYVVSLVVHLIQANDPQKMEFLAQYFPDTLKILSNTLQAGADAINSGNLNLGKGRGYKVSFKHGSYKIKNTDTSMWRNDWDDYKISASDISQPILDALQHVQTFSTNAGMS